MMMMMIIIIIIVFKQEAQLSQRDRAMIRVIEYFAKSLTVTQDHSKRYHSKAYVRFSIRILH